MSMPTLAAYAAPSDGSDDVLREPPHNYEAEQALLGAVLVNNKAYEKVADFLLPEHFADPANGRVFEACAKLINTGGLATPVSLKTYLEHDEVVAQAGGSKYLAALAGSVVTVINAGNYGKLIYDLYLRRELIGIGEDLVNEAFESTIEEPATTQIEKGEQRLFDLASHGATDRGPVSFEIALTTAVELAEAAHRRDGALAGVTTGLRDVDAKLGGLHRSDLLILAGRPSMGKTALATAMAFNAAKYYAETDDPAQQNKTVAFFSLEMSAEQLATRILSERAELNSHDIRTGRLSNEGFSAMVAAAQEIRNVPLYIDDTPAVSVAAMRTRCRRLARQGNGLGLVVVDYLQLLNPSQGDRSDSRVQEVSAITRGLKALAKELDVPVLALSQLSRAVEQREDKRPQLADLRESGSIEQDADVVMFVYREQYYLERAEPQRRADEAEDKFADRHTHWQARCEDAYNKAEVIVAKQRHGPIGIVQVYFDGNYTRFADLAESDHLPEEFG